MIALLLFAVIWWPTTPSGLPTFKHTHVAVTGLVTMTRMEEDGDRHIRVCDQRGCIIAECIPQLPCAAPKVGRNITVYGISRKDPEHGYWSEVHPVIRWETAQ